MGFALRGATDAQITVADGMALYPGALAGSDVLHRVHAEGTEDYVVFEDRPAKEELVYDVDVSRVAGLRLVSNTMEFLDTGGTPRLRIAPPYVVDAKGIRSEAALALEGCAFDASPRAPWGREVTAPSASSCVVRVVWKAMTYPAMVDPSWVATGSMVTARGNHTATVLDSGRVLLAGGSDIANGNNIVPLSSAELYDPSGSGTFAATGWMAKVRIGHTATLLGSGKVLVAGGWGASAELYDPSGSGTFAATGSMTASRMSHTATLLGSGKVLVVGGFDGNLTTLPSAELYDPSGSGTFAGTGGMATARFGHTATLLGSGKVLTAGGTPSVPQGVPSVALGDAELYDPTGSGAFEATGPMAEGRYLHTATLLGSGMVLLVGGSYNQANALNLSSAERYDPTGFGSFAPTGSMANRRYGHTATLLGSGGVLIA